MYKGISETKDLKDGQLVLCKCPEWCDEGYQVATWNTQYQEFEYSLQLNDRFNDYVVAFVKLDENGKPRD